MDSADNKQDYFININVKKISAQIGSEFALPDYATQGAAGVDLIACLEEPLILEPGQIAKVPSGIAIEIGQRQVVALVFARSGLASKHGVNLVNGVGVIDSDYRGEVCCLLQNNGSRAYTIHPGDRVAQMVFMPVLAARLNIVDELGKSGRGSGGFGSTGV